MNGRPEQRNEIIGRRSQDRFNADLARLIVAAAEAITTETPEGFVGVWNAAAERMYGYRADDIVGRPASLLVPPARSDEEARLLDAVSRGGIVDRYETVRVRKDGSAIPVWLCISPVLQQDGRLAAICRTTHRVHLRGSDERFR